MLRELDVIRLRLRSLFKRSSVDNDLDRELRDHLDHLIEENIARGMSPKEARYAALRAFGNVDVTKEESRDTRRVRPVENLMRDLRHSLRSLLRLSVLVIAARLPSHSAPAGTSPSSASRESSSSQHRTRATPKSS